MSICGAVTGGGVEKECGEGGAELSGMRMEVENLGGEEPWWRDDELAFERSSAAECALTRGARYSPSPSGTDVSDAATNDRTDASSSASDVPLRLTRRRRGWTRFAHCQ